MGYEGRESDGATALGEVKSEVEIEGKRELERRKVEKAERRWHSG